MLPQTICSQCTKRLTLELVWSAIRGLLTVPLAELELPATPMSRERGERCTRLPVEW
jgi:hypothetical protein